MFDRSFILIVLLAGMAGCSSDDAAETAPDYAASLESLLEGTPEDETKAAIETLESAGVAAFPILLESLDDERKASAMFFQEAKVTADGEAYHPRIGDACFGIVHQQLEAPWPKAYRDFYVLRKDNIRDWWKQNKTKSLAELRVQCARKSLRMAEKEFGTIDSDYETDMIAFLRENLEEQKQQ